MNQTFAFFKSIKTLGAAYRCICLLFALGCICPCAKKCKAQSLDDPRFFDLSYQSFSTPTRPINLPGPFSSNFDPSANYMVDASFRFPISLGDKTRVLGQLSYRNEFAFGFWEPGENELDDFELRESTASVIVQNKANSGRTITNVLNVSSNSTQALSLDRKHLRFNYMGLIEWSKKEGRKMGIGAIVSVQNEVTILPVIRYNKDLGSDWSLRMLLPSKILVRKELSNRSRLIGGMRADAASYVLNGTNFGGLPYEESLYRRITIQGVVGYEYQVSKWMGLRLEGGMCMPYRMGLFDSSANNEMLHDFRDRMTPHINVGMFLSLPS